MMRTILGCDPGLDGGLAAISPDGVDLLVMPVVQAWSKRYLDERRIVDWLTTYAIQKPLVFIEAVGARPGQGVTAMFSFGTSWGLLRGICSGLSLPYELVRPQEWQGVMLKGQPEGSEYLVASRLWPHAEFRATEHCKKAHSGLVDSALIGEYGRRKNAGSAQ